MAKVKSCAPSVTGKKVLKREFYNVYVCERISMEEGVEKGLFYYSSYQQKNVPERRLLGRRYVPVGVIEKMTTDREKIVLENPPEQAQGSLEICREEEWLSNIGKKQPIANLKGDASRVNALFVVHKGVVYPAGDQPTATMHKGKLRWDVPLVNGIRDTPLFKKEEREVQRRFWMLHRATYHSEMTNPEVYDYLRYVLTRENTNGGPDISLDQLLPKEGRSWNKMSCHPDAMIFLFLHRDDVHDRIASEYEVRDFIKYEMKRVRKIRKLQTRIETVESVSDSFNVTHFLAYQAGYQGVERYWLAYLEYAFNGYEIPSSNRLIPLGFYCPELFSLSTRVRMITGPMRNIEQTVPDPLPPGMSARVAEEAAEAKRTEKPKVKSKFEPKVVPPSEKAGGKTSDEENKQ